MDNQSIVFRITHHSTGRQIIVLFTVIVLLEYFTMLVMGYLPEMPVLLYALVDCIILAILLMPLVYFLIFRPMSDYQRQKGEAEEALKQSEEKYRTIVETSYEGILIGNTKGEIIFTNKRFSEMLGYPPEEITGHVGTEFMYDDQTNTIQETRNKLEEGKIITNEFRFRRKDGTLLLTQYNTSPIFDQSGKHTGNLAMHIDITERKRSEDILRQIDARYRSLFESNNSVMLIIDAATGEIKDANAAASRYYGWPRTELHGKNIADINMFIPETINIEMQSVIKEMENHFFFKHRLASGELRDVEVYSDPIVLGDNKMIYSIVHDITERIQAENALKESELKFRKYVDNAPHGFFVTNQLGEFVEVNSEAGKITGYNKEELLSMKVADLVPKGSMALVEKHFNKVAIDGFASAEIPFNKKDGNLGYWLVDAVKLTDKRFLGFATDTTERKLAEVALHEQESLLRESQSAAQIGSYSTDLISKSWKASEEIFNLFGIDETFPRTLEAWTKCVHPDFRKTLNEDLQKPAINMIHFNHEYKIIRFNDGQERWVHGIGKFEFDDQLKPVRLIGTIQDITVRKTAELKLERLVDELEDIVNERTTELRMSHIALQKAEEKYRTVAENTYDWETWIGPDGKYIYVPPSCERITSYTVEEFMNDPDLLFKIAHPDYRELVEKHSYDILDGTVLDCSFDFMIYRRDGETRWIGHNCQPVFNSLGKFIGQRGSNRDITQRKNAELELIDSQRHLRELTHRMDIVAEEERIRISREIHDELGHLLTALKYDMDGLSHTRGLTVELVKSEMESMISIIDSLIDSVRKIATDLRPGILDHLGLFPALEWKTKELRNRTKISTHFNLVNLDEMDVSFDKNETSIIFRIVQEIFTNVVRHSKASKLWLSISKKDDYFVLSVIDNGIGFDLKDNQQKSSLGLMGMRERALSIGGEIQIESSPGKGTTVNFLLRKE